MATGLQFKENLTIISGGYRGEGVGSNGVTQNWTETQGDSGSSTVTYWYHDSAQMTDRNSTLVEVSVTDSWTAVKEADNTYKVTIHSVMNFIRRTKVGSPSALSASIFVRRERGGSNIWTSGGCVNAAASATHATNVDLGTYTITLPPGQSAATHGAIYYRSNICGHDRTNPPSIYVDEYWLGINFRNTLPPDYRPGQTWSNTGSSVQTVTGTSINVSNTLQGSFEELTMNGDTAQQTYTGKNVLNPAQSLWLQGYYDYNNGGTYNPLNNYRICQAYRTHCTDATTYTMTLPSTLAFRVDGWDSGGNYLGASGIQGWWDGSPTPKSFTVPADTDFAITIGSKNNQAQIAPDSLESYAGIQLEVGSTGTAVEPFVGGLASPSPYYPQLVKSVEDTQTITVSNGQGNSHTYMVVLGGNLFNDRDVFTGDNYIDSIVDSNNFVLSGESSTLTMRTGFLITGLKPNTDYAYRFEQVNTNPDNAIIALVTSGDTLDEQNLYYSDTYVSGSTVTFNTGYHTSAKFYFYVRKATDPEGANTATISNVQLEEGTSLGTYAPYVEPIKLRKIGTSVDTIYQSGNDWYIQSNIGEVALDSDATWTLTESSGNYLFSTDKPADAAANARCSSDYLTWNTDMQTANTVCINGSSLTVVNPWEAPYGEKAPITTLYDFKSWLSRNNPSVYYVLDQPQDRQLLLPDVVSELNSAKNGGSYTGTTTINVTGDLASPLTVGVRVATGSGTWQSHNRNGGWAGVYNGSTFKEMRTVNGPDGTGDPPTIKHPSAWKNQRKIGLNS